MKTTILRIFAIILFMALSLPFMAQEGAAGRYAEHSKLATGRWVKIRVDKAGVYVLTRSKLASLGFNPSRVCVYGLNTPILPQTALESMPDDMTEIPVWRRPDGSILFYSQGTVKWELQRGAFVTYKHKNNPYSSYVYYFIAESEGDAQNMPSEELESSAEPTTTFPERVVYEKDEYSFLNVGNTFFENYNYVSGNKKTYKMDAPDVVGDIMHVSVRFAAAGTSRSTFAVTIGDTTFRAAFMDPISQYIYGVPALSENYWYSATSNPSVTITHNRASGINGHLDYIRLNYTRQLSLAGKSFLEFRNGKTGDFSFEIDGATENTRVWRVTTPATTCEIAGDFSGSKYTAKGSSTNKTDEYVAVNVNATFPEPTYIGAIQNQDLHSLRDIDYVIVVPANGILTAQAQRLADAHTQKESMRCVVVRADQIYNEFSSGTPDATAIRRFMKMLYDTASTPADRPKNICLFGPGLWDNRMKTNGMTNRQPDDYLLCYESENAVSHTDSYVAEEYFTLLADGKGVSPLKERPDCGVGRIPVATVAQARVVVDKLIAYIFNQYAGAWKNTICMMGDDGNANIHMKDAESIASQLQANHPNFSVKKIYWDAYSREATGTSNSYPNARKDIDKIVDDGALIINYTGHGNPYSLSHEKVLERADFERWSSPRLPLWVFSGCDLGPFDRNEENIGETVLLNPNGGAMGCITTTRTVYATQNRVINQNFMKYVLGRDAEGRSYTLGQALAMAKGDIASGISLSQRDSINKVHFVLLGDPAISLNTPTYRVVIDQFNNAEAPSNPYPTVGAGALVDVGGYIADEAGNPVTDYQGIIAPTVFDNLEKITCKNNAKEDVTPYEFYTRTRTLFTGTDSIRNGRFAFSFLVPLDINYSNKAGLIGLYAISNAKDREAHGRFENFLIGGTSPDMANDTDGPQITISLNDVHFKNESESGELLVNGYCEADVVMNETPFFVGTATDPNGINTIGSGVGHDVTLIIDNDPNMTFNLNNYFQYTVGSWKEGTVKYSLPRLSAGRHSLLFRVWDMLNNPSSLTMVFDVEDGLRPNIFDLTINGPVNDRLVVHIDNDRPFSELQIELQVFDITGREMLSLSEKGTNGQSRYTFDCDLKQADAHMPPGIYICKVNVSQAGGKRASASKKFIVKAQ